MTTALLTMLWYACTTEQVSCHFNSVHDFKIPMISGVICLPFLDRIWCILSTFFCLTVLQCNIRAYYAKLYPIVSKRENDSAMTYGMLAIFSLPLIGFFDEHQFKVIHFTCAGTFFISTVLYSSKLAGMFYRNKASFTKDAEHIERLHYISLAQWGALVLLALSKPLGINTAFVEWTLGILYLNFFGFASFVNPYFDSVEPKQD
jgi:hypothetical protein